MDRDFTEELEANFYPNELGSNPVGNYTPRPEEPRLMPLLSNGCAEYEASFVRTTRAKKPSSFSLMFLAHVLTELVETEEAVLMAEVVLVEKLLQRELVTVNKIYNVLCNLCMLSMHIIISIVALSKIEQFQFVVIKHRYREYIAQIQ